MKNLIHFACLFLIAALFASCEEGILDFQNNTPAFDMDRYEENIHQALDGSVIGYAYTIGKDGQQARTGQDGWARTASNPPATPQSFDKPMHVASVSKTLTAVAILKLLDEKGLTADAKVAAYLPSDWTLGPGVENLTFKDLLSHRSGLTANGTQNGNATQYDSLQFYISQGVGPKVYDYSNSNYALFRVILPHLWGVTPWAPGADLDEITAEMYVYYMQENIFKPIGIDARVDNSVQDPTLYYSFPESVDGGVGGDTDFKMTCGGFGWYLSSHDMANFAAHMYFDEQFFPSHLREQMEDDELGWFGNSGDHGTYYSHNGGWRYTNPEPPRGLRSCLIHFPNGVQTALVVNSRSDLSSLSTILKDAFDDAWTVN
jgi:CubicO group peptidase (beta-lactamase class C family)